MQKRDFDVLVLLEESNEALTQRKIASALNCSVGAVNKIVKSLTDGGYMEDGMITEKGLEALEPYRVKRAVFIVAGFGSRLVPITLNTPKPLVRVKGERIIDSLLDAVVAKGIEEIYLVRGYLGEQFDQLLYKYPMIKFIENDLYNESNNISSVYCARDFLKNAYILEGDLLLYKPELIKKYQYSSNYLAVPVESTDDWCFFLEGGRIAKLSVGGENCHHMFGISYWTEKDGEHLGKDVEKVFLAPGGKERYWDVVALDYCKKNYNIGIRECSFNDIVEIDTFNELKQIDKSYDM